MSLNEDKQSARISNAFCGNWAYYSHRSCHEPLISLLIYNNAV
jgi:hypothetical protein